MKRIIFLVFAILITTVTMANKHKFYVSITEITFNSENNRLHVSTKLFYDDLQKAIYVEEGKRISDPLKEHKAVINLYIQRHFKIIINDKKIPLTLVKLKPEVDAVWCSFESGPINESFNSLQVLNSIFVDLFPRQSNIINFFPEEGNSKNVEGLLLTRRKEQGTIHFK